MQNKTTTWEASFVRRVTPLTQQAVVVVGGGLLPVPVSAGSSSSSIDNENAGIMPDHHDSFSPPTATDWKQHVITIGKEIERGMNLFSDLITINYFSNYEKFERLMIRVEGEESDRRRMLAAQREKQVIVLDQNGELYRANWQNFLKFEVDKQIWQLITK